MGRELVLYVRPGDPDLERVETLRVIGLPVLAIDLARVNLRAEELGDAVAVDRSAGIVRDPLAPGNIQLGLAVGAGMVIGPVPSRQDDAHLLAQLDRELLVECGPGPAALASVRPVPLVTLLVTLVDPVAVLSGIASLLAQGKPRGHLNRPHSRCALLHEE